MRGTGGNLPRITYWDSGCADCPDWRQLEQWHEHGPALLEPQQLSVECECQHRQSDSRWKKNNKTMHPVFQTTWSKSGHKEHGLVGDRNPVRPMRKARMKRIGNIYKTICSTTNIEKAIEKSSLGKRSKPFVANVLENKELAAEVISDLLISKRFLPAPYKTKKILDGAGKKERIISQPKYFPDQVVHWALMLQIQPIIERGMYSYSCGSVPGRGTDLGAKMVRRWMDNDRRNTKYCLKLDVSKFYPSIDNERLKEKFRRIIKCPDTLGLIDAIIDSAEGLPIGNFTSQWFANFFLQDLDHHIKQSLGAVYYVRYVDDLVIFGPNKRKLHKMRIAIGEHLARDGLSLKKNYQVFRVDDRGVDFLGLRFFRHKTILRKRNALRIRRRIRRISKKPLLTFRDACAVISYWGWIKRSNSFQFYHKHVRPHVQIARARKVVSHHAKIIRLRTNPGVRSGNAVRQPAGPC